MNNIVFETYCNNCKQKSPLDNHRDVRILVIGSEKRSEPNAETIHLLCKDCIKKLYESIGEDYVS